MRNRYWRFVAAFIIVFCLVDAVSVFAQHTTYSTDDKKPVTPATNAAIKKSHKALLIPFEPKLYLSEIDQSINRETKLNFEQIRHTFRMGLDFDVATAFRKSLPVVSLMNDTANSDDMQKLIYSSIGYDYSLLPDANGKMPKDANAGQSKIQNGQLTVTTNNQQRFMNTKLLNSKLLLSLSQHYGTDVFIFINELDIKFDHTVTIHYSIFNDKGKSIAAGIAVQHFTSTENDPKKIIHTCFAELADKIYAQYLSATTAQAPKQK